MENKGLVRDDETVSESQPVAKNSPTYIHFGEQHVTSVVLREQSSLSGVSSRYVLVLVSLVFGELSDLGTAVRLE